jgi:DNA-binding GntR family transcriptional regulator
VPAAAPTPRRTAQDAAIQALRERIAAGRLQAGEQIRQEQLADDLGVSVIPVREALKTLEAEGQVVYRPHQGYFVARLDAADLVEAYVIRDLLESEAVRRSLPRLGEEDFLRLEELIEDMDRHASTGDVLALTAANRLFHFTLFDAAAMPRLVNFVRILWDATDPYRSLYFAAPAERELANDEHREILVALRSRDADKAVALLREHRDNAIASLTAVLENPAKTSRGRRQA